MFPLIKKKRGIRPINCTKEKEEKAVKKKEKENFENEKYETKERREESCWHPENGRVRATIAIAALCPPAVFYYAKEYWHQGIEWQSEKLKRHQINRHSYKTQEQACFQKHHNTLELTGTAFLPTK